MFLKEKENHRSPQLLEASRSVLLVIDIQEKFRKVVMGMEEVSLRSTLLVKAAAQLQVPVLVSEQYPQALGKTLTEIAAAFPKETPIASKLAFSALDCPEWADSLRTHKRNQFVLCGVETHVCVLQTAMDILQNLEGQVYIVEDAVASRKASDRLAALRRLEAQGAQIITSEMVLFEWLRKAGTPDFKALQPLVK